MDRNTPIEQHPIPFEDEAIREIFACKRNLRPTGSVDTEKALNTANRQIYKTYCERLSLSICLAARISAVSGPVRPKTMPRTAESVYGFDLGTMHGYRVARHYWLICDFWGHTPRFYFVYRRKGMITMVALPAEPTKENIADYVCKGGWLDL